MSTPTGEPGFHPSSTKSLAPFLAVLLGGFTVGVLDILDALIFFGFRGAQPIRIFQSIASGLLGRAAFDGGMSTAILGGLLHFLISFCIAGAYHVASRIWPELSRRPFLYGPLYGWIVFGIMRFVVIPLSAASGAPLSAAILINSLLIHALGVGLPSALFARAAKTFERVGTTD